MTSPLGLDRLAMGERARVVRILGADQITARLYEMGLTPGRLQFSPAGQLRRSARRSNRA